MSSTLYVKTGDGVAPPANLISYHSRSDVNQVAILKTGNYHAWEHGLKLVLVNHDLWGIVSLGFSKTEASTLGLGLCTAFEHFNLGRPFLPRHFSRLGRLSQLPPPTSWTTGNTEHCLSMKYVAYHLKLTITDCHLQQYQTLWISPPLVLALCALQCDWPACYNSPARLPDRTVSIPPRLCRLTTSPHGRRRTQQLRRRPTSSLSGRYIPSPKPFRHPLNIFDLLLAPKLLTARQKVLLKQDAKAQSLILNYLDSDNAVTACACTTSNEMWKSLHDNHVGFISDQVRFLTAQLRNLQFSKGKEIVKHFTTLQDLFTRLDELGQSFDDIYKSNLMLDLVTHPAWASTLDNLCRPLAPPAEIIIYTWSKLTLLKLQAWFLPRSTPPVNKLSDILPTPLAACILDVSQGNGGKRGGSKKNQGPKRKPNCVCSRVLNAKAFTNTLGLKGPPQPDDLRSFWKAVNSKALTAREREVWFKLILRFTPTRKLQYQHNHDTSPGGVLCDALGCDMIEDAQYTTLQRLFGLPKLKAKLSKQEGAGRMIKIFTGMVLEMISSGRWRMQKHGTRMEGVERRRVVLEERMKLRAGGARGGFNFPPTTPHTHTPSCFIFQQNTVY
ncbi:BQ5605_C030g10760 [Microbotryum silenes-dioicae]|uniref:BQ5605_C030g10760 protein n=1 Tax=Microbotryum silenes-dioicae TaxID=796604 RepID=A0A2X0PC64_9BASI|nr:BQ5605_C030g10760 [Microbotryum silenes-dioicae]